jgi:hypothetical protein
LFGSGRDPNPKVRTITPSRHEQDEDVSMRALPPQNRINCPAAHIKDRGANVPLMALSGHWIGHQQCQLLTLCGHIEIKTDRKWPRREALRLNYGSPFVTVKGLNPRSARAAHEAAPRCGNRK